jgi:signal transduction histidine kinase/DNA-binding CsgD family transcriptional regulator
MKRALHSPWLVALAVLALAALPVLAALAAHREQARRAETLLFERSADVVALHLRLLTSRQGGWQNGLRGRLSNRTDAPEKILDDVFAPNSSVTIPEHCAALGFGALDRDRVVLRWQRVKGGASFGDSGADLLALPATASLLRAAMERPAVTVSEQHGAELFTAMTVSGSSPRTPRGWLVARWNLAAMCMDSQLHLVTKDRALAVRPLDGALLPGERVLEIGESEVGWRAAASRGERFTALAPRVSERAIALTGGACAVLLALLAGLATRGAGLRAALAAEREILGMKDHLLRSVSHEFRTPLSVILSSAELLENYDARLTPERRADALAQIRHATVRMNEMVGQVLMLSRIEQRRLPVEPRDFDAAALAREVAREIETATQARCPIRVSAPERLDATADLTLVRTVLGNLLSNAVKFSHDGEPVELTVARDSALRFIVRDRGPGIAADDLPRVREPFFRAASAAEIPGADDYLPKPASRRDLLASIATRLTRRAQQRPQLPDFTSPAPLERLGISPREAEVLLWMAQGKANADIATILGCTHATVKKHSIHLFEKLGVESRGAAMLIAIKALSSP